MDALAVALMFFIAWTVTGLWIAFRLKPKVAKLALMVLLSAVLWPITVHGFRRDRRAARRAVRPATQDGPLQRDR